MLEKGKQFDLAETNQRRSDTWQTQDCMKRTRHMDVGDGMFEKESYKALSTALLRSISWELH